MELAIPPLFDVGKSYRRVELHEMYGGQRQSGIITPSRWPIILLVTGKTGVPHGYRDEWIDDGSTFLYYGEGQSGDMRLDRGNRAIRDHVVSGRELHLFRSVGNGFLEYVGEMTFSRIQRINNVRGTDGVPRQAIAFWLVRTNDVERHTQHPEGDGEELDTSPLADLRRAALASPPERVEPREARRWVWRRSRALRLYVLGRAAGRCEGCRQAAPFAGGDGRPYLEAHHTRRISDGGPDDPRWVTALCPNCHRRAHYADDAVVFNDGLKARLAEIERDAA